MKTHFTFLLLSFFWLGLFAQETEKPKTTEIYIKSTFGPSKGFKSDRITDNPQVKELTLWSNYDGIGDSFSAYTREFGLGVSRGNKYLETGAQETAYVFTSMAPSPNLSEVLLNGARLRIWQIPVRFGLRNQFGNSKMAYHFDAGLLITFKKWRENWSSSYGEGTYRETRTDSLGNTQEAFYFATAVREGYVYENNLMNMIMLSPALRLGLEYEISDRVELGCLFSLVGNGTDEMYEVQAGYKAFDGEEETIIFINDGGYKSFAISLKVNLFELGD